MSIPPTLPPLRTYYDPTLWNRLVPLVRDHQVEKSQHLIDGRWIPLEEAREIIGYLRALDWLISTADELTRVENRDSDQE